MLSSFIRDFFISNNIGLCYFTNTSILISASFRLRPFIIRMNNLLNPIIFHYYYHDSDDVTQSAQSISVEMLLISNRGL